MFTKMCIRDRYNIAVEGYSLIRKVIGQSDRELIDTWLRKRAEVFIKDNDCLLYTSLR